MSSLSQFNISKLHISIMYQDIFIINNITQVMYLRVFICVWPANSSRYDTIVTMKRHCCHNIIIINGVWRVRQLLWSIFLMRLLNEQLIHELLCTHIIIIQWLLLTFVTKDQLSLISGVKLWTEYQLLFNGLRWLDSNCSVKTKKLYN